MNNIGITLIPRELLYQRRIYCQASKKLSFHHPKKILAVKFHGNSRRRIILSR
ncbi:MAG: hypothetical protein ACTS8H_04315 [Arsenophonus sp. NC-PE1-MAG3]